MTFRDPQYEINQKFRRLEELQYGKSRKHPYNKLGDFYSSEDSTECEFEDVMDYVEYIREHNKN